MASPVYRWMLMLLSLSRCLQTVWREGTSKLHFICLVTWARRCSFVDMQAVTTRLLLAVSCQGDIGVSGSDFWHFWPCFLWEHPVCWLDWRWLCRSPPFSCFSQVKRLLLVTLYKIDVLSVWKAGNCQNETNVELPVVKTYVLFAAQLARGDHWLLQLHLPTTRGGENEAGGCGQNQGGHPRPVAQRWGRVNLPSSLWSPWIVTNLVGVFRFSHGLLCYVAAVLPRRVTPRDSMVNY